MTTTPTIRHYALEEAVQHLHETLYRHLVDEAGESMFSCYASADDDAVAVAMAVLVDVAGRRLTTLRPRQVGEMTGLTAGEAGNAYCRLHVEGILEAVGDPNWRCTGAGPKIRAEFTRVEDALAAAHGLPAPHEDGTVTYHLSSAAADRWRRDTAEALGFQPAGSR